MKCIPHLKADKFLALFFIDRKKSGKCSSMHFKFYLEHTVYVGRLLTLSCAERLPLRSTCLIFNIPVDLKQNKSMLSACPPKKKVGL